MKHLRRSRLVFAALALLLLPSCIGFHREWTSAQKKPGEGIAGAWIGSWESGHNGHKGKLRCVVTKKAPGRYEFYYWATWARVISGGFRIECEVEEEAGKWSFDGDKDLGRLGGKFAHEGKATKEKIEATFGSDRGDHGTFSLERP